MDLSRAPFEVNSLKKGSEIERRVLARFFGEKYGTNAYSRKLVKLCKLVQRQLKRRGLDCTVASRSGDLVVLTDGDALAYNSAWYENRQRAARRNHRQLLAVDLGNLTAAQRVLHGRVTMVQGRELAAMVRARRELIPIAHRRAIPVLPGAGG